MGASEVKHVPRQLVRVMEECAELAQVAAKILRFGPDNWHPKDSNKTTNTVLLRREIADLAEALEDLGEPFPAAAPASGGPRSDTRNTELLERAEGKLRAMAREFMGPHFTDRHGDGPAMLAIADAISAALTDQEK